jgi:hypothetical protein
MSTFFCLVFDICVVFFFAILEFTGGCFSFFTLSGQKLIACGCLMGCRIPYNLVNQVNQVNQVKRRQKQRESKHKKTEMFGKQKQMVFQYRSKRYKVTTE